MRRNRCARMLLRCLSRKPEFFPGDPCIVAGASLRVEQDFVRAIDNGHYPGGALVARMLVGMIFLAERLVGRANDEIRRITRDFEIVVVGADLAQAQTAD